MKKRLRVSVRELVEHSLRSGDLDLESWGGGSPIDAIRAHQKIQASRGETYRKEVSVAHVVETDRFVLEIGGRIDGVLETGSGVVIEEIKTTGGDLDARAAADKPTHWGQLQVYAYIYALQNGFEAVEGRLTYVQLDSGETRELERHFTLDALERLFDDLARRYLDWTERIDRWLASRDGAIATASFPFPAYRAGQREMAVQVYRTIERGGRLLVRASTGIGKTQATLFPAMKALGEGKIDKIFYLTARTTGRGLAEKAVRELGASGGRLKSVTLTAKDKICFNPDKACNGEECEFARGFYDRIGAAVEELFARNDFDRASVEEVARRHRVCPFELSLELALWADVVVCDYNYVFDPRAYLRRFFEDAQRRYVFLVDEAHNLVDRARDMFSAELRKRDVLALRRALDGKRHRALRRCLSAIQRAFLELDERYELSDGAASSTDPPESLYPALRELVRRAEVFLADRSERAGWGRPVHGMFLDFFFEVSRFLHTAERFDARYVTCYEANGRDIRVKLFCADPSNELSESLDNARATVFFSATLTPMDYFRTTLGCGDRAASWVVPSPFPRDHLRVLVHDRIATTFRQRDTTRETLAHLLSTFVEQKPGNYLVYFPSYAYLNSVAQAFFASAETILQRPDMNETERAAFLERFSEEPNGTLVGFAVMGGFFGEGIDLVGERLTGAAIVGVGLPGLSPERDHIRDHFERTRGRGFEYAYVFPGMNRVLQAAGRVIRSETDRGAVLLIDERFAQPRYRNLLPEEWQPTFVADESALRTELISFWSENREKGPDRSAPVFLQQKQ